MMNKSYDLLANSTLLTRSVTVICHMCATGWFLFHPNSSHHGPSITGSACPTSQLQRGYNTNN
ncbi:hypothetical protein BYT27DRAFT_7205842 [Phlegmacium glaucopus]|nr:hypothetical protein BYT27DRAFT_7205842 [Phlegmacium glaucopus]